MSKPERAGEAGNSASGGKGGAAGASLGLAGSGPGIAGSGAVAGGPAGAGAAGTSGVAGWGGMGGVAGSAGSAGGLAGSGGSAGTAGGSAGGGSGGKGGGGPEVVGPTPATATSNFPFPQNRHMSRCTYPTNYRNSDVVAAYQQFKTDTVVDASAVCAGCKRVQRLASDPQSTCLPLNSTVSEGIAYGMLIAVYMDDQPVFDGLWKYSQKFLDSRGLMDWAVQASGQRGSSAAGCLGAASDADEDMAFALVMADKQWGGKGTLDKSYLDYAKSQITNIWNNEVLDSKVLRAGDSWGTWDSLNISYFAPYYYRVFKAIDGGHAWDAVLLTSYDTIKKALKDANGNTNNGLVPAWSNGEGNVGTNQPFHYQYDSCRTPFRVGQDFCLNGDTRASDYVSKTSNFFSGIGAANIVDGYELNGNKKVQFSPATGITSPAQQSSAFIGPAAVGAMVSPSYQTFLNEAYTRLVSRQMMVGGAYYDESWLVMSLLMLTGNFLDYTAIQPVR
jgi:endo-1,4-beta-D-glucanase Y